MLELKMLHQHNGPRLSFTNAGLWDWPEIILVNLIGAAFMIASFVFLIVGLVFIVMAFSMSSIILGGLGMASLLISAVPIVFIGTSCSNFYVVRLVKHYLKSQSDARHEFVCQVTCSPRLNDGMLGFMEDADDIGYLRLYENYLEFEGLTFVLTVPFGSIFRTELNPPSYRAMWLAGESVTIMVAGIDRFVSFKFGSRSAASVIGVQQAASEMVDAVCATSRRNSR